MLSRTSCGRVSGFPGQVCWRTYPTFSALCRWMDQTMGSAFAHGPVQMGSHHCLCRTSFASTTAHALPADHSWRMGRSTPQKIKASRNWTWRHEPHSEAKLAMLEILNKIEQGQPWPQQLITGFVVALEKTPGAETVNQYRPITVFSLCYRVWSSIRARQVLHHLQPYAPSTCTGNLPGKQASHLWYGVM